MASAENSPTHHRRFANPACKRPRRRTIERSPVVWCLSPPQQLSALEPPTTRVCSLSPLFVGLIHLVAFTLPPRVLPKSVSQSSTSVCCNQGSNPEQSSPSCARPTPRRHLASAKENIGQFREMTLPHLRVRMRRTFTAITLDFFSPVSHPLSRTN